jgi:isoamyl acetate esterase
VDSVPRAKKIVFLGDSLTEGVDGASYLRALGELLAGDGRLPPIDLINAGQGGDTVRNLARRVSRDVVPHAPDSVVVFVGVNDCRTWYVRRSPPTLATGRSGYYFARRKGIWRAMTPQRFERGLRALVDDLRARTEADIALCTPATASESRDPRAERMLDQYANAVRRLARERNCALIDVRAAMLEAIDQSSLSATSGLRLTIDGVHLSVLGAQRVADVFHEWLLNQFPSRDTR